MIEVAAEYGITIVTKDQLPLWDDHKLLDYDAVDIQLVSVSLREDLMQWNNQYEKMEEATQEFVDRGRDLAIRLKIELNEPVTYFNEITLIREQI